MTMIKDIQIQMMLSSDSQSQEPESCFMPEDIINGSVEISSKRNFRILKASVFFEGVSRIWVSKPPVGNELLIECVTAENKFLRQTLDIPDSQIKEPKPSTLGGFECSLYFHFLISKKLVSTSEDAPDQCRQLPPAIELGPVQIDPCSKHRYAQPNVSYTMRLLVVFAAEDYSFRAMEVTAPITILPRTDVYPPTDTSDFPAEFRLQETKRLKKSIFRKTVGSFRVSVEEPSPIKYDASHANGTTVCRLNFEFFPHGEAASLVALQDMRLGVLSLLRQKTFYSVKAFPRLPSQTLVNGKGTTRMRDESTELGTERSIPLAWTINEKLAGQTNGSDELNQLESSLSTTSSTSTLPQISQNREGKWLFSFELPILISSRLQPTFCSSLVAILYSVIIRVQVRGIKSDYLDLEVPVQVVHTSRQEETEGRHPDAEEQWAPTTTWFNGDSDGDLSLPPPHYFI